MNTLYLDCRMGITSAKIFGALVDIMENPNAFIYDFNKLGMSGVSVELLPDALNGITGVQLEFRRRASDSLDMYDDEIDEDEILEKHHHRRSRTLEDVIDIIEDMSISNEIAGRAIRVYENIVKAYAKANNKETDAVKLRRTGSRDIIASIVGTFVALDKLKPEKVIVSTVAVGDGYARTPRGKMPIPVPEVQLLLEGMPFAAGTESGELCTLCGAALISEIADEYGSLPEMSISKSGAGFGRRTFKSGVNCVRAYFGEHLSTAADESYIKLTSELYGDTDIPEIADELKKIGIINASMSDIYKLNGEKGHKLTIISEAKIADSIATYLLEKTDATQVIRQLVSAYSE